jgi:hypothetical protein
VIPDGKADWLEAFRRCGLSDALIEFALGEPADPLFESICQRELLEQPFEYLPDVPGPPVTPLWHVTTSVVGCRKQRNRLEFVRVEMEEVFAGGEEPVTVIAHSEQGLWASLFCRRLEAVLAALGKRSEQKIKQLRDAAKRIGFVHFETTLERVKAGGEHEEFILALK